MTDAISDIEVADIQSEAETLLRDTGRVLVYSATSDGAGGQKEIFTPSKELPCAIAPVARRAPEQSAGDRISEAATHVVTFPAGTAIKTSDRVEISATTYSIVALYEFGAMAFTRRIGVKAL